MSELLRVNVSDGKYTVIQEADGRFHAFKALRYGKPWRDLVGDNLILCLAYELDEERRVNRLLMEQMREFLNVEFKEDNCASLEVASKRIVHAANCTLAAVEKEREQ